MKPVSIILHHTVTDKNISPEALRAIFKARFGVDYIGYNFYIRGDGSVHSDIGAEGVGIHNNVGKYNNSNSVGIALAGNFEEIEPTKEQLNTLSKLIKKLQADYYIPDDKIFGHKDLKSTACPGKNLYKYKPWKEGSMDNLHEWNAQLVRTSRQDLFGKVDPVGAEADIKLLDGKFIMGDKYEAGNLLHRYFESQEFKKRWILRSEAQKTMETEVSKSLVAYEAKNATVVSSKDAEIKNLKKDLDNFEGILTSCQENLVKCQNASLEEATIGELLIRIWEQIKNIKLKKG